VKPRRSPSAILGSGGHFPDKKKKERKKEKKKGNTRTRKMKEEMHFGSEGTAANMFPITFRNVTSIPAFHRFSEIYPRHTLTSIWKNMKYQRISKYPLKPAVRVDGVLSKFKFDREFEFSPAAAGR